MSDVYDGFRAMKEASVARRASNRETSAEVLRRHDVAFVSRNDGAHLIVSHAGKTADFWPGTGKYRVRGTDDYRRGVFNLLRALGCAVIPQGEET